MTQRSKAASDALGVRRSFGDHAAARRDDAGGEHQVVMRRERHAVGVFVLSPFGRRRTVLL